MSLYKQQNTWALFYLATRVITPLGTFRVTACWTALGAIPVFGESGSTHFS
jgi:hypothetical protein